MSGYVFQFEEYILRTTLVNSHQIYTEQELHSRYEILLENYCKTINIEALTMVEMANRDILPAVSAYSAELSSALLTKEKAGADCTFEKARLDVVCKAETAMYSATCKLTEALASVPDSSLADRADYFKDEVLSTMNALRIEVDRAETVLPADKYPYPTYGELLFGICK